MTTPVTSLPLRPGLSLRNPGDLHLNLSPTHLVEAALARKEGSLSDRGALSVFTAPRTGRSPKDKFLVAETGKHDDVAWGPVNQEMSAATFDGLLDRTLAYLQGRDLFVCDAAACADPRHELSVRVVADTAWQALFAQCLLRPLRATPEVPELTILAASGLHADPGRDGTKSEAFIVLNLDKNMVLIGGTRYAGEIKKAVFTFLNYRLPYRGVFPMHCSANIGSAGNTALFFGLSGTGKTTLSADPDRRLIGDDEHGWSDDGVFNVEGGCYAKCIRLSKEGEPAIWNALRFGSVLENVRLDPVTRVPDFDDESVTENTRAAYPVHFIDGAEPSSRGGHPKTVLFLTCDAFGVLPPVAKLTPEQALYHFLSGYTAKVAGTEAGVTTPEATFSTCFAAPFLPLPPVRYATMLREKLARHGSDVYLVNTGWSGGPAGQAKRLDLAATRAMVRAALGGTLRNAPTTPDPVFGLHVPQSVPGVDPKLLRPRDTWKDPAAYDAQAKRLAELFHKNFTKYAGQVEDSVRRAGPAA